MAGGRKKEFDRNEALDAAMRVFWKQGYIGASLSDLTEGMGINKPSMYSTFGNKEELFVEATNHYLETHAQPIANKLTEPGKDLITRIQNYLLAVLSAQCDEATPKGCYISLCVGEAAGDSIPDAAKELIEEASNYSITQLTSLFKNDEEANTLGLDKNASDNALYLVTSLHGTASLARAGKTAEELKPVISCTMQGLLGQAACA